MRDALAGSDPRKRYCGDLCRKRAERARRAAEAQFQAPEGTRLRGCPIGGPRHVGAPLAGEWCPSCQRWTLLARVFDGRVLLRRACACEGEPVRLVCLACESCRRWLALCPPDPADLFRRPRLDFVAAPQHEEEAIAA